MSVVRKTFWYVVSSVAGGSFWPRKYGFSGCMPALMSSVEVSSAGGIRGADGSRAWPFCSKKRRNPSRISAVVRMTSILGAGSRRPSTLSALFRHRHVCRCSIRSNRGGGWRPRDGSARREPAGPFLHDSSELGTGIGEQVVAGVLEEVDLRIRKPPGEHLGRPPVLLPRLLRLGREQQQDRNPCLGDRRPALRHPGLHEAVHGRRLRLRRDDA